MNPTTLRSPDFENSTTRASILTLLNTALRVKEYRFARQAALAWLAAFPGDLEISLIHARALIGEGKYAQVAPIVEELCNHDPEYIQAQSLRTNPEAVRNPDIRARAQASLLALVGEERPGSIFPEWARRTWSARQAFQSGEAQRAETLIHQALATDPPTPLPAILHLQITRAAKDFYAVRNLANVYTTRWPDCLQFKLYLAEALIETGDETSSVALLHQCAAHDASCQVPARIWGSPSAYQTLWPSRLEIFFDLPIPASISGALGLNQLVGGSPAPAPTSVQSEPGQPASAPEGKSVSHTPIIPSIPSDLFRSIQDELERLAQRLRKPGTGRADGRFPIYVVFSSRQGFEKLYGPQTTNIIESEMKLLAEAIRKRLNWGAIVYLADDPSYAKVFGLTPAESNDPWKLKLAIHDLDAALSRKGEMIGSMLIVGGSEVVPHHRLPNPTDDADPEVASDNPYASLDDNYFIPNWPLGRLPGGAGSDAGFLLSALRKLTTYHKQVAQPAPWWQSNAIFSLFFGKMKKLVPRKVRHLPMRLSFGYSAAVWRQSSMAVFKMIGDPQALLTCPPVHSATLLSTRMLPAQLGYFNLHGLADGPDWYGQREVTDNSGVPDYPVAFTPKDILGNDQATKFVYTEACYGALIDNKTDETSLALKFISSGVLAIVGSTCVSYGSVTTPLIGADLLGYHYWKNLREGHTAGESLLLAKLALTNEMNKRQGFLDGEDQKTLISFVLYGDPLATMQEAGVKAKGFIRQRELPAVRAISDKRNDIPVAEPISEAMLNQVKSAVNQYLPGLRDARVTLSCQMATRDEEGHPCTGSMMGARVKGFKTPQRTVVRLCKQIEYANRVHQHYARITLDQKGKLVKMSVSR